MNNAKITIILTSALKSALVKAAQASKEKKLVPWILATLEKELKSKK